MRTLDIHEMTPGMLMGIANHCAIMKVLAKNEADRSSTIEALCDDFGTDRGQTIPYLHTNGHS